MNPDVQLMIQIDVANCLSFYYISLTAQNSSDTDMVTFFLLHTNLAKWNISQMYFKNQSYTTYNASDRYMLD